MSDELEAKWRAEFEEIEGTNGSHWMAYLAACRARHAEAEVLRAENARLKAITNPANAEGHVKTLLAWAEIYGAECSCGECTHCAHYLPALQAGAVALAENARLREALENQ